ncbi:MAG: hypothetical protein CR982_04695 [Candidatus Cloacimonadota bacterium]|nr:MAG: hypothetical protein CR982_04695 [Candidatus Cloacimonadota bacterium]PIE77978.1 MAG: hypothetical protein CSA15_10260 [Candidatus Delongbacteria bacterium]
MNRENKKKIAKIHREGTILGYESFSFKSFDKENELLEEVKNLRSKLSFLQKRLDEKDNEFNRAFTEKDIEFQDQLERVKSSSYDQGFADGELEGSRKGEEKVVPAIEYLHSASENLNNLVSQFFTETESVLINLVKVISQKTLSVQIENLPESTIEAIKQSISVIQDKSRLKILVSEKDISMVKDRLDHIKSGFDDLKHITIDVDSRVDQGGVIIESDSGYLDARLKVRLDEILAKIDSVRDEE